MPTIRELAKSLTTDGNFSLADARAVSPDGRVVPLDRRDLLEVLGRVDVDDVALAHLGIARTELRRSSSTEVLGDVRRRLDDIVRSAVYAEHDIRTGSFKLGDHAGLKVDVKARLYDPQDPLIKDDRYRQPVPGVHTVWASSGILLRPSAGFSLPIDLGPGKVDIGFSGSASIGVSALAPYHHPQLSDFMDAATRKAAIARAAALTVDAAKNMSVRLPFTADRARALATGTEVVFRGSGRVAARAEFGAGKTLSTLVNAVRVGADVVVGGSVGAGIDLAVRVKRLDRDRVFVALSRVDERNAGAYVRGTLGVDSDLRDELPGMGGVVIEKPADIAAGLVDKEIERWLSIDLRATHQVSKSESEIQSYVIDLGQPRAKEAYDALLRLDTRMADDLARDRYAGVTSASLDENVRSTRSALEANFGPITLLSAVSNSTTRNGVFESTNNGRIAYDRAMLDARYFGILSQLWLGDQRVRHEIVTTQRGTARPEPYYHLHYEAKNDRMTTKNDVRQFLAFASYMGALGKHEALRNDAPFLRRFDDTDRTVDVFFTGKGLEKLANTARSDIERTYAIVYRDMDRPPEGRGAWRELAAPWLAKEHEDHRTVMNILETGEAGHLIDGALVTTAEQAYEKLTGGRSLAADRAAYGDMKRLCALVDELRAVGNNAAKRAEVIARAHGTLNLDFWKLIATAAFIVGSEDTLVSEISIKDRSKERDFVLAREGAIQDVDVEIKRLLSEP